MAGPGGNEVERISVKVVPDTDGFAAKLKAYLEKLEKQLKLTIHLELDKSDKRQVEAQLRKLQRDLRVKVNADVDNKGVEKQLKDLAKDVDTQIKVDVDDAAAQLALFDITKDQQIELKVDLDPKPVQLELFELTKDLETKLKVDVEDKLAEAQLKALERPRKATVRVDVDRQILPKINRTLSSVNRSITRTIGSISGGITGVFSKITSSITSGLGSVTSGLGKLGAISQGLQVVLIGSIIPAIAGLVVAAGALAGALALALSPVPFIGAGIAFAFLAAKGNKTAAELKKSFLEVGKTAKSVISDAIEPMARAIQAQMPDINRFVASLKGPLRAAFQEASRFVDEFSHGIQNFITGALGGLVLALRNPAMQAAVTGFEVMLGRLGFALGFFVQELARHGVDFGNTLTAIGDAMVSLLPALARMLGAFASVSPQIISALTAALEDIFATLSDPAVLQAIATLSSSSFHAIALAVSGIATAIVFTLNAWQKLKAVAESTWNSLKTSSNSVVSALRDVWDKIWQAAKGAFDKVKKTIVEDLIPAVKDFLPAIQPIVAFLIKFFGGILVDIIKDVGTVLAGLIKVISGILNVLTGILTGDWSKIWQGLKQITEGVLTSIWALIRLFLLSKVGAVFRLFGFVLRGVWRAIWRPLSDLVEAVLGRIVRAITSRLTAARGVVTSIGNAIRSAVSGVWNAIYSRISSVVGRVASRISSAWNTTRSVTSTVWNGIKSVIAGVVRFIEGLINRITGAVNKVKGFVDFLNPFSLTGPDVGGPKSPGARKFFPTSPGDSSGLQPRPVKGVWSAIGDLKTLGTQINGAAQQAARQSSATADDRESATPSTKNYTFHNYALPEIPAADTILKGLSYMDALYSHG